jgi:N-acetylneuraminate synthase
MTPSRDLIEGRRPQTCVVIAELGVNHNGRLADALELVEAARRAGADAVKLQLFVPSELCSRLHRADELAMLERLRLSDADHVRIVAAARERDMPVFATPFDEPSLALLRNLGIPIIKVGSGEVTHTPLLRSIASTGLPVILSTGGCEWADVDRAVAILCAGAVAPVSDRPSPGRPLSDRSSTGRSSETVSSNRLSLLHCTSAYPPPDEEVNLRLIPELALAYPDCTVGLSDHTLGFEASVAAVALGAKIIEKHLTLDRDAAGPDHAASADPAQFAELVAAIRRTERMLGDGCKTIQPSEGVIGRSILAARVLPAGHVLTPDDLAFKRPGGGVRPWDAATVLGRALRRDLPADEFIQPADML